MLTMLKLPFGSSKPMGNFFPQLSSGALAQYPIRKTRTSRTVTNALPDGSMVVYADSAASKLVWQMRFEHLSATDANALVSHYTTCCGPYHGFTFIDPTDNMLADSSNLLSPNWKRDPQLQVLAGATDPY